MLQAVGQQLQRDRLNRKLKPMDVERLGGPSYKTVQAIEDGEAGHIESLDRYARALQLSIVDIFDSVLASQKTPLSPEAAQMVRKFNETTVAGRTALLAMANALPPAAAPRGPRLAPPAGPRASGRSRPGPPGGKRRTEE